MVPLTGLTLKPTELQVVAVIAVMAGVGLTVIDLVAETIPQKPPLVVNVNTTEVGEFAAAV